LNNNLKGSWKITKEPLELLPELYRRMGRIVKRHVNDGRLIDFQKLATSADFRAYCIIASSLSEMDLRKLSLGERLAFFLNIYNFMFIHATMVYGLPKQEAQQALFFSKVVYNIGGYGFSLNEIEQGILRNNVRKIFKSNDPRLAFVINPPEINFHFGIFKGTSTCPSLFVFSPKLVYEELRSCAEQLCSKQVRISYEKKRVCIYIYIEKKE
jgi:hypothetical protein